MMERYIIKTSLDRMAFRARLQRGEAVFGSWIQECPWPGLIQIYAMSGMDCVFIGMEHSSLNPETVARMIMCGRQMGIATIVRTAGSLYHQISKPMDWGASGVMVPQVESADEAQRIVAAAKYAPVGQRGMSATTAHCDYCCPDNLDAYRARANEENLIIVQIETAAGLENVDAITAIPEIDVIFIGSMDLSCSLGFPGEVDHPRMQEATQHIMETAEKYNKPTGMLVGSMDAAYHWHDRGVRLLTWSNELRMIAGAARQATEAFKAFVGPEGE